MFKKIMNNSGVYISLGDLVPLPTTDGQAIFFFLSPKISVIQSIKVSFLENGTQLSQNIGIHAPFF